MRKETEDPLKSRQPALIVTYGNTTRKCRPLDRDLLVLGRAPACDITLVSPEVSSVHCLVVRSGDGWRIRDCNGGRLATRLNGKVIHDEVLRDGDTVQVGSFSFQAHLPPPARTTPVHGSPSAEDPKVKALLKRLQRKRRRLVQIALRLRLCAQKSQTLPPTLAELQRQADCLRTLQQEYEGRMRDYETRVNDLEQVEREVCDERAALEQECADWRAQQEEAERELAGRTAEVEAQLVARFKECEERCRQMEQAHAESLRLRLESATATNPAAASELALHLDRRSQELNHFARHLRRWQRQVLEQTPLPGVQAQAERQAERVHQLECQREQAQRASDHWGEECHNLRAKLAELETKSRQQEIELAGLRAATQAEAGTAAASIQELQGVAESLRREIQDRDQLVEKLRRQLDEQASRVNLENSGSYERDLLQYHQELERDRHELNEQIYHLQVRQAEMEASVREAELQMSRERAQIARERADLNRLRDEVRLAQDPTLRKSGVRERLTNLRRPREEAPVEQASSETGS
jgi:pSer/pThr/pTyr-binding forkhead associated (FHA) protein